MDIIRVTFKWPELPDDSYKEEFFLGAWHPTSELRVILPSSPSTVDISTINGKNWFISSSRSPFRKYGNGLAHTKIAPFDSANVENTHEAVAFRGYILEPPIHSWSESGEILNYWKQERSRHNGVFVTVIIANGGRELKFISDAFGIATLYYREFAGGIIFSTNTRFLTTLNDRIDYASARILMHCNSVYGNGSLTKDVRRIPAGSETVFNERGITVRKWFSNTYLPQGTKPVSLAALRETEEYFQNAISRCLLLQSDDYMLPLSSGYDSRRILAALQSRYVPFNAITVRVLQKKFRDLDGHWASVMSKSFGFKHKIVELPEPDEYARLDHLRRLLVDSHGTEHTWFLTMYPHIPPKSCLIFDGLGGDIFGNTGFGEEKFHTAEESSKIQMILDEVITDELDGILNPRIWPNSQSVRKILNEYLEDLPDGRNKSDVAFLLLRCRSGTGMCFQRLIPVGHLIVYPYFDLDYAIKTLEFDPLQKIPPDTIQARCLSEFWPEYYAFPGSRRIPDDTIQHSYIDHERRNLACFNKLKEEAGYFPPKYLFIALTKRAFAKAIISNNNKNIQRRVSWWLVPLLMILARENNDKICWTHGQSL